VTLGVVDGHPFLETASIGLFGEAIRLGETLKERMFQELPARVHGVVRAKRFEFALEGDIEGHGRARSLVFANTRTSGTNMPVGESTPTDASLDLSIRVGASRRDLVSRLITSVVLGRQVDPQGMQFRFRKLTITTSPAMQVWADDAPVARTPVTISSLPNALRIIGAP
jgi:diacylglycerol kinase family enzyme